MKKEFFLLTLLFTLVSCTSNKVVHTTEPVYVTNTKSVYILSPENMEGEIDSLQLLNGNFGETTFTLFVYFQSDKNGMYMSLLNDFGTDMGSLSYDGTNVVFDSAVFPANLKAEYIICDIQNAYYNLEGLSENYRLSGLSFEETEENGNKIRLVKNGKKIIERITFSDNSIKIQNILRGYEYNLTEGEE